MPGCEPLLALLLGGIARADPPDAIEEIEVVAERPDAVDPRRVPSSVTVVHTDDLPDGADAGEAVRRAPGTVVQRLGGLGAWSSVSIRGSATRQVEVLLDGVPLNPEGGSDVNLSELPLSAFERVEVYRGGAPLQLGSSAMGGVVNLVTGERTAARAALSTGSFGTARASALWSGRRGSVDGLAAVDALSTEGDFTYLDDRGTPWTDADDGLGTRGNNDTRQLAFHGRVRLGDRRARIGALHALVIRDEGVPGYTFGPAEDVRYGVWRALQVVDASATEGAARLTGAVWGYARAERLDDRAGEIGVGRTWVEDRTTSAGGRFGAAWIPSAALRVDGTASARGDRLVSEDRTTGGESPPRTRTVVEAGASTSLASLGGRAAITPEVRGVVLSSGDGADVLAAALPRLGARVEAGSFVLKASGGASFRPPDTIELFGDRGAFVGNPELVPERAWAGDIGALWTPEAVGPVQAHAEVAAFARDATDLVVWVQGPQGVAQARNLARARTLGLEGAAGLAFPPLSTHTNATWTDARNRSEDPAYAGHRIPRVPALELLHETTATFGPGSVAHQLSYTAGTFLDDTNFFALPPRPLHALVLAYREDSGWGASVEIRNLADRISQEVPRDPLVAESGTTEQPISDFLGYPLPGRTLLVTLRYRP